MNPARIVGIIPIVAGALGLIYGGFSYTKETSAAGPIRSTTRRSVITSAASPGSAPQGLPQPQVERPGCRAHHRGKQQRRNERMPHQVAADDDHHDRGRPRCLAQVARNSFCSSATTGPIRTNGRR